MTTYHILRHMFQGNKTWGCHLINLCKLLFSENSGDIAPILLIPTHRPHNMCNISKFRNDGAVLEHLLFTCLFHFFVVGHACTIEYIEEASPQDEEQDADNIARQTSR